MTNPIFGEEIEINVHCDRCNSTNLKVKAEIVGEGLHRRIQRYLACKDCGKILSILAPRR